MSAFYNVGFAYLYRDAGNYKQFGRIVLSNARGTDLGRLRSLLADVLIDGIYFDPAVAGVPAVFFTSEPYDPSLDHSWHEFDELEPTNEQANDPECRDVETFIRGLANSKRVY